MRQKSQRWQWWALLGTVAVFAAAQLVPRSVMALIVGVLMGLFLFLLMVGGDARWRVAIPVGLGAVLFFYWVAR